LANSNYSTILEQNGILFLCLKSVERAHTPAAMWQLVRLNENYDEAFHQVSKALEYWSPFSRSSFHADQFIAGLNFLCIRTSKGLLKLLNT